LIGTPVALSCGEGVLGVSGGLLICPED